MKVETRGALVGMVLGDAYVGHRQRGPNYAESFIQVKHSVDQVDLCAHKLEIVQKGLHAGFRAKIGFYDAKLNGKTYRQCQFRVSHPYFQQLRGWAYPNGRYMITRKLLDMLTPQGIALWYMDDGSARVNLNKDGVVTSCATDIAICRSEAEAVLVCEFFDAEYGVGFKPRKIRESQDNGWIVQAATKASHEFAGIVQPYVIPTMLYKLKHVADLKTHECRAPVGECRECSAPIYDNRRRGYCGACYARALRKEHRPAMR